MGVVTRAKKRRLEEARVNPELPPGGDAGGPDLISSLPEDVLCNIIALLPPKDGGRTQILSRRWRPLWRSAPLNFEASFSSCHPQFMATILESHEGPVRRFSLNSSYNYDCLPVIDSMLESPKFNSLQEFELFFNANSGKYPPVPRSVLSLSPTLRVLVICSSCETLQFPIESACSIRFQHLKQLTLRNINISESTLHGLLSRCPVLEGLVLVTNMGHHRLRINSLTLRSLGMTDRSFFFEEGNLGEVIIEDAPLLQRLVPYCIWQCDFVIRVIHAPKLKTLGYLSHEISILELGTLDFQKLVPASLSNAVRTVKILALDIPSDLDAFINFIKYFPCTEKLYIMSRLFPCQARQGNLTNVRHRVSLECLDLHLKMVEYINYKGNTSDVNFIKFFVLNARVLKSMKFVAHRDKCDVKWIQKQHKKLWLNSRVSQGVKFDFEADYGACSLVHMKHISDLTTDDPFDRSLCRCNDDFIH